MAKGIGVPQQAWARYERGVVAPNAETLEKICRVHACSADWLLGIERSTSAALTVQGNGNAIATGANAVAVGGANVAPCASAACRKCPYKTAIKRLQKAGLKIPGLD